MNNWYYFTIKASELTRDFDLLNSIATSPEELEILHWDGQKYQYFSLKIVEFDFQEDG